MTPRHFPHSPFPRLRRVQSVVVFVIKTICCVDVDVILVFAIIVFVVVAVNVNHVFWSGSGRRLGRIRLLGHMSLIYALSLRRRKSNVIFYRHYISLSLGISHTLPCFPSFLMRPRHGQIVATGQIVVVQLVEAFRSVG